MLPKFRDGLEIVLPNASPTETVRMLTIRRTWMRRWWFVTLGLWATVGIASLWSLRKTFYQITEYFTWTAIRYGLGFNRPAAIGLGLCVGLTVALLVKETRFILFGLTRQEQNDLRKALKRHQDASSN
ncbi:MAG: hypothetical protein F6K42_38245 [Leptolyngbya sp. SIO1D8]|nr:hypothetical protein [Leptolyngbya sp. SIO1D8]